MATPTKYGSEFLVNTITVNAQNAPSVEALANGTFVIAWTDASGLVGDGFDRGIAAQIFHADGSKSGSEFLVNAVTTSDQRGPDIAALPDGRFIASWLEGPASSATGSDFIRIFNADGSSVAPQQANIGSQLQGPPRVTVLNDGTFVGTGGSIANGGDIAIRTEAGFFYSFGGGGQQFEPRIATLSDGRFVVVYWDFSGAGDGSQSAVFGQLFNANGTLSGGPFLVNTTTPGAQEEPEVAALPGGGFVITWLNVDATPDDPSGRGIRARVFPEAGAPGADFGVNTSTGGVGAGPTVATLPDGRFIIAWATGNEIRAQVFLNDGTKDGGDIVVNTTSTGFELDPVVSLTTLSDGRVVVSWTDVSQHPDDFSDDAVRAQILDPREAAINLVGTALGDEWVGTAFNDTMTGATGNDRMDGGGGTDTAVFSGLRSAYTIGSVGSDLQIIGPDGTDLLKNFEFAKFDDLTIALAGSDSPQGSPGDDNIAAPSGSSQINGGAGIDTITFNFKLTDVSVSYVGNQVIIDGPSSHTVLTGFEKYVFADGTVNNNDGDPLVDDLFYYSHNHDVWNAHADADAHFHAFGWREFRDPSAFFDTDFYLALNVDVRRSGADPLVQFDQSGWKEGRIPSPAFDPAAYLSANPDVKAAGVDPLAHFLQFGAGEGRQPFAVTELIAPNGFDYIYYLQHNPDVAAAHVDPFAHFSQFGWKEGRNPNALFDTNGYLATYADVKAAGVNPLDHYHQSGWHEGRDPSVNFDTTDYLANYPDIAAANIDPLAHFLRSGIHEGRSAFPDGVWG